MKNNISLLFFCFLALSSQCQVLSWVKEVKEMGNEVYQRSIPESMTIDEQGNIYAYTSAHYGITNFSYNQHDNYILPNFGYRDHALIKYDPNGNVLWAKYRGGVRSDYILPSALNFVPFYNDNNIIYADNGLFSVGEIRFTADIDFDPNNATNIISDSTGGSFIARYDTSGSLVWHKTLVPLTNSKASVIDIISYSGMDNSLYVRAWYGDENQNCQLDTAIFKEIIIAKLDAATGKVIKVMDNYRYKQNYPNIPKSKIQHIDNQGDLYSINSVRDSINIKLDFGQPNWKYRQNTSIGANIGIAKYTNNKQLRWFGQLRPANNNSVVSVDNYQTDTTGNLFVAGAFTGSVDFDIDTGSYIKTNNHQLLYKTFVAKYNTNGVLQWVTTPQEYPYAYFTSMFLKKNGGVLVLNNNQQDTIPTNTGSQLMVIDADGNVEVERTLVNFSVGYLAQSVFDNDLILLGTYGNYCEISLDTANTYYLNNFGYARSVVVAKYKNWAVSTHDLPQNNTNIFPNPARDIIHIRTDAPAHISIYDITGRQVRHAQTTQTTTDIDVNNLSAGIYTVKIIANKNSYAQKLVIVR